MSGENLEVVRKMLDAVNRRDPDGFLACLSPEIEWDDHEGWPESRGVYHGRAAVREWWDAFLAGWERLHAEVEEIAEVSLDRVLLGVLGTFRAESSGAETHARAWYVFWLVDGRVARAQLFWVRSRALEAAGLSE